MLVRGYVYEVVISCGPEVTARHPRSYEREDFVYDPFHHLPLLEQRTRALDQAAPLQEWDLPEEFATLGRPLESGMGRRGKREFIQVLRLTESFQNESPGTAFAEPVPAVDHLGPALEDGASWTEQLPGPAEAGQGTGFRGRQEAQGGEAALRRLLDRCFNRGPGTRGPESGRGLRFGGQGTRPQAHCPMAGTYQAPNESREPAFV